MRRWVGTAAGVAGVCGAHLLCEVWKAARKTPKVPEEKPMGIEELLYRQSPSLQPAVGNNAMWIHQTEQMASPRKDKAILSSVSEEGEFTWKTTDAVSYEEMKKNKWDKRIRQLEVVLKLQSGKLATVYGTAFMVKPCSEIPTGGWMTAIHLMEPVVTHSFILDHVRSAFFNLNANTANGPDPEAGEGLGITPGKVPIFKYQYDEEMIKMPSPSPPDYSVHYSFWRREDKDYHSVAKKMPSLADTPEKRVKLAAGSSDDEDLPMEVDRRRPTMRMEWPDTLLLLPMGSHPGDFEEGFELAPPPAAGNYDATTVGFPTNMSDRGAMYPMTPHSEWKRLQKDGEAFHWNRCNSSKGKVYFRDWMERYSYTNCPSESGFSGGPMILDKRPNEVVGLVAYSNGEENRNIVATDLKKDLTVVQLEKSSTLPKSPQSLTYAV